MTFAELAKAFLASRNIRAGTLHDYTVIVEKRFLPEMGTAIRLPQLTSYRIEQYRDKLRAEGKAVATINKDLTLLRMMCGYAQKHGFMASNPAQRVDKLPTSGDEKRRHMQGNILSPTEANALLLAASKQSMRAHTLLRMAIETGMRQGELLALKWEDLELQSHTLHVRRSIRRGVEGSPKSAAGIRSIGLTSKLAAQLKVWRHSCPVGPLNLVFPTETGHHDNGQNITKRMLRRALKAAELRHIRFHDLRHTCASLLLMAGRNPKEVQVQLGHASVEITLNVYSHVLPNSHHGNADAMQALLTEKPRATGRGTKTVSPDALGTEKPDGGARSMAQVLEFPGKKLVPERGVEPPTRALRMRCSTN